MGRLKSYGGDNATLVRPALLLMWTEDAQGLVPSEAVGDRAVEKQEGQIEMMDVVG